MCFLLMQKAYELEVYGLLFMITFLRELTDDEFRTYLEHLLATCQREPH